MEHRTADPADHRIEKDSMGEMPIPADRLYGAQTERARRNFPISDLRFGRRFIEALGAIKLAASRVNRELELLDPGIRRTLCFEEFLGQTLLSALDNLQRGP